MRILCTGNAGFLAHHVIWGFQPDHEMHGIDRWTGDLRDPSVLAREIRDFRPDLVMHLAAQVGRLFGEDDHMRTIMDNALVSTNIALACRDADVALAYTSTSEVYGDQGNASCFEGGPMVLPHNLYGLTKRWGEEAILLYCPEATIFRISMPYGPGLPAGRGRAAIVNFLHQARHRQPIPVHKGAERSWCYVADTVAGLKLIIESGKGGIWNVGRDDAAVSMLKVAETACDLTAASPDLIEMIAAPPAQTVVKRLATEKLRLLGWTPQVDLREGMQRTLDWLIEAEEKAA